MSKLLILLLSFLLVSSSFQAWSQSQSIKDYKEIVALNKRDTTEVQARSELFKLLFRIDVNEAKKHLDKGMKLARELNYKKGMANCYNRYSILYTSYGNYDKALEMSNKAEAIFVELNDLIGLNSCVTSKANIQISLGNYDKALELYMKAEKMAGKMGSRKKLASAQHNISLVYYTIKDYDNAHDYLTRSLEVKKELSDSSGIMTSYNGIGAVLSSQGKHKDAIAVFKDALVLANQLKNLRERASISSNIGVQYYYLKELDSTRYYYIEALNDYQQLNAHRYAAEIYSNLGGMELELNNSKAAKAYYDSCLIIAENSNAMPLVAIAYQGLSEVNSKMNNDAEALSWYKKYHKLNDSLVGERVKNNINELQVKYEAGKKDLKIAALEKSRLEERVKDEKSRQLIIIIVAAAIIVLTFLFFKLSQRNARAREKANVLEQKVFRAQMNPHFIFNSLNSIQRMYIEGNEDRANDYMADFSRLLRSILENSGKNRITLKEELELTANYLELEKLRTRDLFEYQIDLDDDIDPLLTKVPPLIFQPYIENAIWHGVMPKNEKGNIRLAIRKATKEDSLVCEIVDDGVGFNAKKNQQEQEGKTSQGMAITAERLGGEQNVKVDTPKEGGTRVTLKMNSK